MLAPAAAYLAAGTPIERLGGDIDPAGLVPGLVGLPNAADDGTIDAEVWWVDRFGNCQLNLGPDDLAAAGGAPGAPVALRLGARATSARWVRTYSDAKPSELVVVVDSYGMVSLALDRRSAAAEFGLSAGSPVTLIPPGAGLSGSGAADAPIAFG